MPANPPNPTGGGGRRKRASRGGSTTPGDKVYFPLAQYSFGAGGAYNAPPGVAGRNHYHGGIDLGGTNGQPVVACTDMRVIQVWKSNFGKCGGTILFEADHDVHAQDGGLIFRKGEYIGYGHQGASTSLKVGDHVRAGQETNKLGCNHVHFYLPTDGSGADHGGKGSGQANASHDPKPTLDSIWHGGLKAPKSGGSSGDGGGSQGAAPESNAGPASAFATFFNFPSLQDVTEAILLTGDKSLMNDKPLIEFIEELSQGCMRSFQSLPNGGFFAFFPDYFGGFNHRTAYWDIYDLEILDGKIELNDTALATHVYAVGNMFPEAEPLFSKLQTPGVVTMLNAGVADFINSDPDYAKRMYQESLSKEDKKAKAQSEALPPFLGDKESVMEFLRRYGARPLVIPAPFIRSRYMEAFMAFQQFMLSWSRQFLTTFTFTFQPELYPGGIVRFPDHGIQCYIDEVYHSFDYASGFTTQANLSAPASISGSKTNVSRGMVLSGVFADDFTEHNPIHGSPR